MYKYKVYKHKYLYNKISIFKFCLLYLFFYIFLHFTLEKKITACIIF